MNTTTTPSWGQYFKQFLPAVNIPDSVYSYVTSAKEYGISSAQQATELARRHPYCTTACTAGLLFAASGGVGTTMQAVRLGASYNNTTNIGLALQAGQTLSHHAVAEQPFHHLDGLDILILNDIMLTEGNTIPAIISIRQMAYDNIAIKPIIIAIMKSLFVYSMCEFHNTCAYHYAVDNQFPDPEAFASSITRLTSATFPIAYLLAMTNNNSSTLPASNIPALLLSLLIIAKGLPPSSPQDLDSAIQSWMPKHDIDHNSWQLSALQTQHLTTFLYRLHNTEEAKNKNTRLNLQHRIHHFLEQMSLNTDGYRAQALDFISNGLTSCTDRIILTMNDIERVTLIKQAQSSSDPKEALRQLAKRFMAFDIVRQHAANKISGAEKDNLSPPLDAVEVYLAFEIKCAEALNLPVSTKGMTFATLSEVTNKDIEAATEQALEATNNPSKVDEYLGDWYPWQKYKREIHADKLGYKDLKQAPADQLKNVDIKGATCIITLAPLNEDETILVNGNLYNYSSFMPWWVENGNDPLNTDSSIDIDDIYQVAYPSEEAV